MDKNNTVTFNNTQPGVQPWSQGAIFPATLVATNFGNDHYAVLGTVRGPVRSGGHAASHEAATRDALALLARQAPSR